MKMINNGIYKKVGMKQQGPIWPGVYCYAKFIGRIEDTNID